MSHGIRLDITVADNGYVLVTSFSTGRTNSSETSVYKTKEELKAAIIDALGFDVPTHEDN